MKLFTVVFTLLFLSSPTLFSQKVVSGSAPMIDGTYEVTEWSDATEIPMTNGFHLYIKKNKEYIFIAVTSAGDSLGYVSLYIETESTPITDLHSSARLGERSFFEGHFKEWSEIFPDDRWFNNQGWISNYAWFKCKPAGCADLKFAPAKEFQISRNKFKSNRWKVFIVFSYIRNGKWENGKFPLSSSESKTDGWLMLSF